MNPDPDYSAACVRFDDGWTGRCRGAWSHLHNRALARTIVVAAIEALRPLVVGQDAWVRSCAPPADSGNI